MRRDLLTIHIFFLLLFSNSFFVFGIRVCWLCIQVRRDTMRRRKWIIHRTWIRRRRRRWCGGGGDGDGEGNKSLKRQWFLALRMFIFYATTKVRNEAKDEDRLTKKNRELNACPRAVTSLLTRLVHTPLTLLSNAVVFEITGIFIQCAVYFIILLFIFTFFVLFRLPSSESASKLRIKRIFLPDTQ